VPTVIRWPGVIKPGTVFNDIVAHEDMLPTLLAAAGDTKVKEDLLQGKMVGHLTLPLRPG
jgi:arylsulfatase A-like enzyme